MPWHLLYIKPMFTSEPVHVVLKGSPLQINKEHVKHTACIQSIVGLVHVTKNKIWKKDTS